MSDITKNEIRTIVENILPIGTDDSQITMNHIHKFDRTHSTRDIESDELDAVLIELKDETEEYNDAVTNNNNNASTIKEVEDTLRKALPNDYHLINRNVDQHNRVLFEVRAPLTGTAEWLQT